MWNWGHLGIFFALSLLVCLCGFKKYVYFMSIGYGFSVAIIGAAMAVMSIAGIYPAAGIAHYIQFALFVVYGFRLSGFLLIREIKNAAYRKTLAEATGDESKMPIFVKFFMWIFMGVLYDTLLGDTDLSGLDGVKVQWKHLPNHDLGSHWYDSIKLPQSISKKGKKKDSDGFDQAAAAYLDAYIHSAKAAAPCEATAKREKAAVYVEGLLEHGGPSTDVFKKGIGAKETAVLFRKTLFATEE